MFHFENDYNKGAHPSLLQALINTNDEGLSPYGTDVYTKRATEKIRRACSCPEAEVTFLSGGTQTNQLVIDSLLAPYEGVIAADTGHVSLHEAGAIEFSGHKVLTLEQKEGKISAVQVQQLIEDFYADANHEHMVFPGMVYISHPTEYGTLYSRAELGELSAICQRYQIPLFLDGARLGYALAAKDTDIDLPMIAELVDVFYIGGTKMGALIGEAVVFTKKNQPKHFATIVKQHGALLAKGRLTGVQFDTFFTDNLYENIGKQAIEWSEQLVQLLEDKGYIFYLKSPTNLQFVLMTNEEVSRLKEAGVQVGFWEKYDDTKIIVRFATSWSTTAEELEALREIL